MLLSYAMNANLMQESAYVSSPYASLGHVTAPASTVLAFETGFIYGFNPTTVSQDATGVGASTWTTPLGTALTTPNTICSYFDSGLYATGNIGEWSLGQFPSSASRHTNGANYLAADGHVKFLNGNKVSGGIPAALITNAEQLTGGKDYAAGTGNMTLPGGGQVTLTFSPV